VRQAKEIAMPKSNNTTEIQLDVLEYHIIQSLEQTGYLARIRNLSIEECFAEDVVHSIIEFAGQKQFFMAGVRFPRDWWQAFKAQFFPRWLLKWCPVQLDEWQVKVDVIYPLIKLPEQDKRFAVKYLFNGKETKID
jgi:hypothetical protein